LRGIYLCLRACRDVPYIHLQSDSKYALMQINRFWREGCQNCLQTTAHRDLICSTVKELQLRDRRHDELTPDEHVDVDILAKEAAHYPLPQARAILR
jgi:hypothetical protein